jgi:hypothetical protein
MKINIITTHRTAVPEISGKYDVFQQMNGLIVVLNVGTWKILFGLEISIYD